MSEGNNSNETFIEDGEIPRQEINDRCYDIIYHNVCHFRDNWVKEMDSVGWGNKNLSPQDREEEDLMKDICDFIIRTQEILVSMIIDYKVDFASGYTSIEDAIADVNSPDTITFAMMEREHKKFLPSDFYLEFSERVSSGKFKRIIRKHSIFPRAYFQRNGEDVFNHSIFRIFKHRLGLNDLDYRLGLGLESVLGGKCVLINSEDSLFSETPVSISIKEGIGYDFVQKKFYIKPETKILDYVGRLCIDEIPTMTTDNKLWLKYYKS